MTRTLADTSASSVSGRLPYTIGKSIDDYAAQIVTGIHLTPAKIPYSEGLNIDYRHFDAVCVILFYISQS